jgi:hypothetical protein
VNGGGKVSTTKGRASQELNYGPCDVKDELGGERLLLKVGGRFVGPMILRMQVFQEMINKPAARQARLYKSGAPVCYGLDTRIDWIPEVRAG